MAPRPVLTRVTDPDSGRTVHDDIIDAMRDGMTVRAASEGVAVDHAHVLAWRRNGEKIAQSGRPVSDLTAGERAMVRFAADYKDARRQRQRLIKAAITANALGKVELSHVKVIEVREIITDAQGNATEQIVSRRVERSTRVMPPNTQAQIFLLQTEFAEDNPRYRTDDDGTLPEVHDPGVVAGLMAEIGRRGERLAKSDALIHALQAGQPEADTEPSA